MFVNAFVNKERKPDELLIREMLKDTYPLLQKIRKLVKHSFGETIEEWKYYGAKNGWVLKTLLNKRNLFFLSMYDGFFKISLVFGEKAVTGILESEISNDLKHQLSQARKYGEGRSLTITIMDTSYFEDIRKLLHFKINK